MEDVGEGVKVGGKLMKGVRFADDQAMLASKETGLQRLMDALKAKAKELGLK